MALLLKCTHEGILVSIPPQIPDFSFLILLCLQSYHIEQCCGKFRIIKFNFSFSMYLHDYFIALQIVRGVGTVGSEGTSANINKQLSI